MQTISQLKQKAIKAAKTGDWDTALTINQSILEQKPTDSAALNRMGIAYLQLGQKKLAKQAFESVLARDKTNLIAQKQLTKLKKRGATEKPTFSQHSFIEEPGKTASVELHRLAGKKVLESISPGQTCALKPKSRYVSVLDESGAYVGALPEDISFRLCKLLDGGNTYLCRFQSVSPKHCAVFIEETHRDPKNANTVSFPATKAANHLPVDDSILIGEQIPLQIVETDDDNERTFDDLSSESFE